MTQRTSFRETRLHDGSTGWQNHIPFNVKPRDLPLRDISHQGIWTLSSCKHGYGVKELLDDNVEKYWQSDGPQPHVITIEFQKKTDICFIMMYLDFKNDESYTPCRVVVKAGHSPQDWFYVQSQNFAEPQGWQVIDMRDAIMNPQRAWMVQLQVVQNHQNGRDTHIRHVRVVGPARSRYTPENRLFAGNPEVSFNFPGRQPPEFQADYMEKFFNSLVLR
ncbi:unnamed protein product [Caenorhabditis bovis]|uniref:Anaphase-promoting complex subunit 10 n=1 Tax=Caenorhabditis bovis TaxID=2654633 RepID=A0A8S1E7Z5_9PELO|nr:unnamed protein product [Caenorhabditis bovis]